MRVLAVDPGLTRCGVAVVSGGPGRPLRCEHVGVIRTDTDQPTAARLWALSQRLDELAQEWRPETVAVERVFSQHNVTTAMTTAQAAAVVLLAAASRGLPSAEHTPTEVKAAVTGNGRADKAQVAGMVTRLLNLAEPPSPADATDALALAICHLWRAPAQNRLAAHGGAR